MDMDTFQANRGEKQMANFVGANVPDLLPRHELINRLRIIAETGKLQAGLQALTECRCHALSDGAL
jgi:hypothetical protein